MKKTILLIVVLLITTLANAQYDYRICTKSGTVYTPCSNSVPYYYPDSVQTVYLHPGDLLYYCYIPAINYPYQENSLTIIWRLGTPPYANNIDTSTSTPILSGYQDSIISTKQQTGSTSYRYRFTRIKFLPSTAGTISGLSNVCQGTPITFTTPSINYAESYEWTLNGVVQSDNDTSITLTLSPGSNTLTVKGKNAGGNSNIITKTIIVTAAPTASISYTGSPFCSSLTTQQAASLTGTSGGTYSTTAGLSLNTSTGAITPNSSTAGNYVVTYTIPASGGCPIVSETANVTITALPTASISYTGSPFCSSVNIKPVTLTGTNNYTVGYYSTNGLQINTSGAITPSTVGNFTVTYTIPASGGCPAVITTTNVVVNQTPATPTISNIGNNVLRSSSTSGNQWYNQNGIINGAVSQNYTTTANGSYYCIVSNASCSSNPSNSIQITNTGIENMNSNGSFTVYPNPTKSSLNISVNQKLIGSEFTITDQLGRKVITGKLTAENTVVEVGNLSNGIYLLRIGESGQQTFKVVKE